MSLYYSSTQKVSCSEEQHSFAPVCCPPLPPCKVTIIAAEVKPLKLAVQQSALLGKKTRSEQPPYRCSPLVCSAQRHLLVCGAIAQTPHIRP